ncbi:MAG TPA: CYTH domain-containing protein, partial [Candidatus Paceibacterota bacterium]
MATCEVEIKSLLGSKERALKLRQDLQKNDSSSRCVARSSQLNHYFVGGDTAKLKDMLTEKFSAEEQKKFSDILERGKDFSIRTRLIDGEKLLFVLKASLDEGTSHNTVSRLEFETAIPGMSIEELDRLLLDAGFSYQAKWSREREEYSYKGATVCLD